MPFLILLPKGILSLKKGLYIFLTKIKSMERLFQYCSQREPEVLKKFVNLFDQE